MDESSAHNRSIYIFLYPSYESLWPLRTIQRRRVLDVADPVVQLRLPTVGHDGSKFRVHEQTGCEGVDLVLLHTFEQSVPVDALVLDGAVAAWENAFVEPVHGEGCLVGFAHGLFDKHLQAVHCTGESVAENYVRREAEEYLQLCSCWSSVSSLVMSGQ